MPLRMFTDTLATLRFGAVNEELSKAMAEAVLAASTNGGKAEVVLKLQIKAGKAGQIKIGDQVLGIERTIRTVFREVAKKIGEDAGIFTLFGKAP